MNKKYRQKHKCNERKLTLGFVASRQNVNKQNGQTNVQEYNHADHNRVRPLRKECLLVSFVSRIINNIAGRLFTGGIIEKIVK